MPGGFGIDPVSAGLGAAGLIGNYLTGKSAANSQKEMMRRQAQLIQHQNQTYNQTQPYFQQYLSQLAGNAGLNTQHVGTPTTAQFGLGGDYGNQTDQLRLAAAQDDINRHQMQGANQLRFQLGQRGLADASIGAALGRNAALGQQQYGAFRRQLAIQAPQEQERRMALLQNAIGMGFGQGSQASQGYGQQAGQYGQQANQAYAGLGGIVQNWQQQQALQHYMNQYGVNPAGGGGGYPYAYLDTPVTYGTSPGYGPNVIQGPPNPTDEYQYYAMNNYGF